jgi:hypothetical protein
MAHSHREFRTEDIPLAYLISHFELMALGFMATDEVP